MDSHRPADPAGQAISWSLQLFGLCMAQVKIGACRIQQSDREPRVKMNQKFAGKIRGLLEIPRAGNHMDATAPPVI